MFDLPSELWHRIAHFLESDDLDRVFPVNSALFNLSMDHRWRKVVFETRTLARAMKFLDRLSDPFISAKVKSLKIVFNAHAERSIAAFSLRRKMRGTLLSQKFAEPHPLKVASTNFVKGLIARVPTFTNVRDLTIDSWGARQVDESDLSSLYGHLWEALENRLECLTLKGNLDDLERAISSAPMLSILRRLHIDFGQNINETDSATTQQILVSVIAPFVKKMNAHLVELKIWCWASLDMSSFFDVCNSFPRLEYLAVRMAFDKALPEPSGLRALLWNSAETLQRLEMRLNPTQVYMNAGPEAQLGGWLLGCLNDERCLSQVQELDLYPSTTADGLAVVLAGVGRASATLQRLIIRDRYFVPAEALEIIDALSTCRGLRYLRMNILRLEIDIVDRMAARLPNLEGLWLSLGDQISTDNPTSLRSEFMKALAARKYDKWKVADLSLWQGGAEVSMDAMRRFSVAIPEIESFFERGHML